MKICLTGKKNLTITLLGLIFYETSLANVFALFPLGADAKSAAIESAVDSNEPQALLYNPASLRQSKSGVQGELGLGKLLYRYEHPLFDPVNVSVTSPLASVGWKNSGDQNSNIHWGFALLPTSMADLNIKGLPRRVDGKLESLNVHTIRKQFHLPVGAAWSPDSSSSTTVGAAAIFTYDERKLTADSLVDGVRIVDLSARGQYVRPIIGVTQSISLDETNSSNVDIGISYVKSLTKHFKGETKLATGPAFDTETVDYDPAVLSTGVRLTYSDLSSSLNVNRVFGSGGANVIRDGLARKTTTSDVRDVNQLGVRLGYKISDQHSVSGAYAYLPTIWGAGSYGVDADGFSQHELGHLFGTFNAMPVRNQAISYTCNLGDWRFRNVFFRTAGQHAIDSGGDNPGYYQLEFVSLSSGVSREF